MDAVLTRLPATLALTGAALGFALLLGVPLGIVAGVRPRGWSDFLVGLVVFGGQAMPGFWLGTVLIVVFAIKLDWLPASGLDGPGSLVLPAMALAAFPLAIVVRLLRTSLIETMRLDYVRTARTKGLNETSVVVGHALRNAALPALAYAGVQAGFLLGGAVVVEAVFAYPGMGRLVLQAVEDRDLPVVQAFVVLLALLIVAINLMVDVLARWLDPRMRFGAGAPSGGSA
jgi:peptide/nickel transport system permease protein